MGRRPANHVFMAGVYVFPGGRVDRTDARVRTADELRPGIARRLAKSCALSRARALAVAAIRELYEEAGLMLGTPIENPPRRISPSPTWRAFAEASLAPSLAPMEYVARAITPPGYARRFHARFFLADARHVHGELSGDGELSDLCWVSLSRARDLPIARITGAILDEVKQRFADRNRGRRSIPVFKWRDGSELLVAYD